MSQDDRDLQPLVEEYLESPSRAKRKEVVMAGLPLVRSIIGKISVPDHFLAAHEDLESVGIAGLLEALDNYDPDKARFATHAYQRIRGSVIDYLRSIDVLSRNKRKKMGEVQEALSTLRQTMGEEPSGKDVADYMGISVDKYYEILRDAQCRFSLSLSRPREDDERPLLGVLRNEDAEKGIEQFEKSSTRKYLKEIIQTLPERQQDILGLYYLEDLTLQEVGEVLDLSAARISQLLGKIQLTLRSKLEEQAPET